MLDLFITYAHQSEEDVRGLLEDLTSLGDKVWCEAQQSSGPAWWDQTLSRIRLCDALLFALTPKTLESEACWRELQYAHVLGKRVLAIELGERTDLGAMPTPLGTVPFVSYGKRDHDAVLRLCKLLRSVGKATALPAVLPAPPGVPPTYLAGLRELVTSRGKLDVAQQNMLMAELTRDSRELHSSFEARQLLLALRQRRELPQSTIDEIDVLLRKTASTQIKLRPPPGSLQPSSPRTRSVPAQRLASTGRVEPTGSRQARRVLTPKRVVALLGGLVSCAAAGCLLANGAHPDIGIDGVQMGNLRFHLPNIHLPNIHFPNVHFPTVDISNAELVALLVLGAGVVGAFARFSLARALAAVTCAVVAAVWLALAGQPDDGAFVSSLVAAPAGLLIGTGLSAAWRVGLGLHRAQPS